VLLAADGADACWAWTLLGGHSAADAATFNANKLISAVGFFPWLLRLGLSRPGSLTAVGARNAKN